MVIFYPDIGTYMVQLLPHPDDLPSLIQADPIELSQILRKLHDFRRIVIHGLPVDQIQGIIQKVRIDLRLQRAQLCRFHIFTQPVLLQHQLAQLLGHITEAAEQLADFIAFLLRYFQRKLPVLYLFHLRIQRYQTL